MLHGLKGKVGNLRTTHQFADFHLKFDFKLSPGTNNGLGIRYPGSGNAAYNAMELQIIDFRHARYVRDGKCWLKPYQNHGGIYTIHGPDMAALEKAMKPANEWNHQEVIADGTKIKIVLNGIVIQDVDLAELAKKDPGLLKKACLKNTEGYIAFLGHRDEVFFRNIAIKPLLPCYEKDSKNVAPEGFTALFDGKTLTGWQGGPMTKDPVKFAALPADKKAAEALLTELVTRIVIQPLPYQHGIESKALESLYSVFGTTRKIIKDNPGCEAFARKAIHMLNVKVRPITAKWDRLNEQGALESRDGGDAFRIDLADAQEKLQGVAEELHEMAYGESGSFDLVRHPLSKEQLDKLIETPVRYGIPENDQIEKCRNGTANGIGEINPKEDEDITARRKFWKEQGQRDLGDDRQNAIGLAFSGGGIRSATFCLGVEMWALRGNE